MLMIRKNNEQAYQVEEVGVRLTLYVYLLDTDCH